MGRVRNCPAFIGYLLSITGVDITGTPEIYENYMAFFNEN
jgi:hypothetical protein